MLCTYSRIYHVTGGRFKKQKQLLLCVFALTRMNVETLFFVLFFSYRIILHSHKIICENASPPVIEIYTVFCLLVRYYIGISIFSRVM